MARALPYIGYVVGTIVNVYVPGAGVYIYAATAVVSGIVNAQQARKKQKQALDASRRDNITMVRSAEQPHRVVYGSARVSGPIVFTHSTGAENGNLYIIVVLTSHEIAEVEEIVFNETRLGVTGGEVLSDSSYFVATLVIHGAALIPQTPDETGTIPTDPTPIYTLDSNLSVTLPVVGTLAYVTIVNTTFNAPGYIGHQVLPFHVIGNVVTIDDPGAYEGLTVYITWAEWVGDALVDVAAYLGTTTQLADEATVDASGGRWTTAHRLLGRSYIRARLVWNFQRFVSGVPNISARVRGRLVHDPRSPTESDAWSSNSALCILDYLTNEQFGMGCDLSEIDLDSFIEAANICDEYLTVDPQETSDPDEWRAVLAQGVQDGTWEALGDGDTFPLSDETVNVTNGTSIPDNTTWPEPSLSVSNNSAAAGTYVEVPTLPSVADGTIKVRCTFPGSVHAVGLTFRMSNIGPSIDQYNGYRVDIAAISGHFELRLFRWTGITPTSLGNVTVADLGSTYPTNVVELEVVLDGSNIRVLYQGVERFDVNDATYSSGETRLLCFRNPPQVLPAAWFFDITFGGLAGFNTYRQRRYTCNGTFTVDRTHEDILSALLSSCAGQLTYTGGVYRLVVGAYQTPTITLTVDDLRGPIQVTPKKPRRELFNAVRGIYASKSTFDQPTDFPAVTNDVYEAQDGGERIDTDLVFEFTNDVTAAQRIAKIHLEKHRQGIVVQMQCKLGKALHLRPGDTFMLTNERFGWSSKVFRVEQWSLRCDEDWGIDIVAQEEAAENYDWNLGDATVIDPAPDTGFLTSDDIDSDGEYSDMIFSDNFNSDDIVSDDINS